MWMGKRVVLGITGGIAAYKAAELTREIVRRRAAVRVVMTRHAREFITPLTLETLSGNRVCTDLFAPEAPHEIDHIALARWADVLSVSATMHSMTAPRPRALSTTSSVFSRATRFIQT